MHDNEKEKFLEKSFFEIKKGFSQSSIEGSLFLLNMLQWKKLKS